MKNRTTHRLSIISYYNVSYYYRYSNQFYYTYCNGNIPINSLKHEYISMIKNLYEKLYKGNWG